jgi:hypothetical protein
MYRFAFLAPASPHSFLDPSALHFTNDKLFNVLTRRTILPDMHLGEQYNGGVAQVKEWKISCYLEVMPGGIPCTNPNLALLEHFTPLLDTCNDAFLHWYRQQHSCNQQQRKTAITTPPTTAATFSSERIRVKRLMTFVTRYTPNPGEQALLKHVDGAGKVDGSVVVALPVDRWSAPEHCNSFQGGGLTFWDGRDSVIDLLKFITIQDQETCRLS